ncbi:MAG: neprosin family prolyl endopeptidase [Janthinobacterium lividum]
MLSTKSLTIGVLLTCATASVQAQTAGFTPFDQFVAQLSTTSLSAQAAKPLSKVSAPAAFEQIRSHLLGLYAGVSVKHSFVLGDHAFDCVPVMQQPSVRQLGVKVLASPPAIPASSPLLSHPAAGEQAPPQIDPAQKVDAFGNAMGCEDGTIPMRRVTLDDVSRFETLGQFLRKGPGAPGTPQRPDPTVQAPALDVHKYSHSYQYVSALGGTTDINLWNPKVDTSKGEIFSLSQFWYVNTNGPVQTVETGVQNYPQLYGTNQSVLFIYWTSDGYGNVGCYNLMCPGFIQTNKSVLIGADFQNYSTLLGQQYYARLSALNQNGNWWIYLGGTDPANAIGYYPAAVFHGTPITQAANIIDYGGEVVGSSTWPQMGSGSYAQARFRHAASQKQISYYPDLSSAVQANLSVDQPSISCFTNVTNDSSGYNGWNSFFYFGGPGGAGC